MILNAVHPAPVLHVPARGRVTRAAFVRTVTAVEVREVSVREMEPLDLPGLFGVPGLKERPHYLHGGSAWAPVGYGAGPAGPDDLAAFLECRPAIGDKWETAQVQRAFVRSPLTLAPDSDGRHMFADGHGYERGDELGRSRETVRDGRAEASRRVADFVERNVLLVDGGLHMRVAPYAVVHRHDSSVHTGLYVNPSDRRGLEGFRSLPAAPDEADAVAEILMRGKRGTEVRAEGLGRIAALPEGVRDDADLLAVANCAPGALRYLMDKDLPGAAALPQRAAMRDLELAGRTWWVDGAEAEAALPRIAEAAELLVESRPPRWRQERDDFGVPGLAAVIREVYLQRFERRREAQLREDAEALGFAAP